MAEFAIPTFVPWGPIRPAKKNWILLISGNRFIDHRISDFLFSMLSVAISITRKTTISQKKKPQLAAIVRQICTYFQKNSFSHSRDSAPRFFQIATPEIRIRV
jgi:hypothetical protein